MGHLRLGRLPLRHNWMRVVESLEASEGSPARTAALTVQAAERSLRDAAASPEVVYPFWVLVQLAHRSSSDEDFGELCRQLGISYEAGMPALELAERFVEHIRSSSRSIRERTAFAESALAAFQQTLLGPIRDHPESLFEAQSGGLREALANHSGPSGFGRLSREFLGSFFGSIVRVAVSYALPASIGSNRLSATIEDADQFNQRLDAYARDVSQLVAEFSSGWYSKNLWQSGEISEEMARGFLHVAFRKFRQQLEVEEV